MSTLINIVGLFSLLQVVWCAPSEKIAVEIEDGNASYPFEEENSNDTFPVVDEGEPTAFFLKEVREYLEGRKDEEHSRITKRHIYASIYSGTTIALQTTKRNKWVSCYHSNCDARWCPGLYMRGIHSTQCTGERFRIYRKEGSGAVKVGDYVGIFYIYESRWLGCGTRSSCFKTTCPGFPPSIYYGFINEDRWYQCSAEVFRIYARGKGTGVIIQHQDDVSFYHVQGRDWLSHWGNYMHRTTCHGGRRPPSIGSYDTCYGEIFKIWQRP